MRARWATTTIAAILVAITGGVSTAGSQQYPPPAPSLAAPPPLPLFGAPPTPSGQGCDDDLFCRLDEIDARLARIERHLSRGGGGGSNGASIAVGQYCRRSDCPAVAAQACVAAGFTRGGADELSDNGVGNPMIVRAVCFD